MDKYGIEEFCPPDGSNQECNNISAGLHDGTTPGRRIYIHQETLIDLATQSEAAALLVYEMIAQIAIIKAIHHHVEQDGVLLGLVSPERAHILADSVNQAWSLNASTALRQVGYRPSEPRLRDDCYAVLGQRESIAATCYFSNYYTFATDSLTARMMFIDTNDIATMKQRMREGLDYHDLTLINGRCLVMIDPEIGVGPEKAAFYFPRNRATNPLSTSYIQELKRKIYHQIQINLDHTIEACLNQPTVEEIQVLDKMRDAIKLICSQGILKIA